MHIRAAVLRALYGVNTKAKHPQYTAARDQWEQLAATKGGQSSVKALRDRFLPYTSGMRALGINIDEQGWHQYDAYLKRAVFPDVVAETSRDLVGLLHKNAAEIELPPELEPMRENATERGESLLALLRRINEGQLDFGRIGLLLDVQPQANMPVIATYPALSVWNWATDTSSDPEQVAAIYRGVVLDETGHEFDPDTFEWRASDQQRVCRLNEAGQYETHVVKGSDVQPTVVPAIQGKTLAEVPFVVANAVDIAPDVGEMPLLGLSDIALAMYRGDADYRHTLFMSGQDTLVISGTSINEEETDLTKPVDAAQRLLSRPKSLIGAGNVIGLPPENAKAYYVGINKEGISEQRESLEKLQSKADAYSTRLLTPGRSAESGDALEVRVTARTATLTTVAKAGGLALERMLKLAAVWKGADPAKVKVHPNLKFGDDTLAATDFRELMTAKVAGLPIALESLWLLMRKKDLTTFETFEDELEAIEGEADTMRLLGFNAAGGVEDTPPGEGGGDGEDGDGGDNDDDDEDDDEQQGTRRPPNSGRRRGARATS